MLKHMNRLWESPRLAEYKIQLVWHIHEKKHLVGPDKLYMRSLDSAVSSLLALISRNTHSLSSTPLVYVRKAHQNTSGSMVLEPKRFIHHSIKIGTQIYQRNIINVTLWLWLIVTCLSQFNTYNFLSYLCNLRSGFKIMGYLCPDLYLVLGIRSSSTGNSDFSTKCNTYYYIGKSLWVAATLFFNSREGPEP